MASDVLLGVDAGNSKTVALVSSSAGEILAWARSGSGDIYLGEQAANARVIGCAAEALARAGVGPEELRGACFSLVGADWPEDFELWRGALAAAGYREPQVVNDAFGARLRRAHLAQQLLARPAGRTRPG